MEFGTFTKYLKITSKVKVNLSACVNDILKTYFLVYFKEILFWKMIFCKEIVSNSYAPMSIFNLC